MKSVSTRLDDETYRLIDETANERDISKAKVLREFIEKGKNYDELEERLEAKEARIDQLEEQLARRSQVEEKVDVLAKRVNDSSGPTPPFPIRWWQWFRSRGSNDTTEE